MEEQIIEKGRTQREISEDLGVSKSTIGRWALNLGFRKNNHYEENKDKDYRNEDWLKKQLKVKRRTYKNIANEQNVSDATIRKWAKKFNIKKYNAQTIINNKKRCSKCNKWKESNNFIEDKRRSTGLCSRCYDCQLKEGIKWQKNNREKRNEYYKKWISSDIKNKINENMSSAIRHSIKNKKSSSWLDLVNYDVEQLMKRLEFQFRDGMCWDNYGEWHIDHKKPKSLFNFEDKNDQDFKDCWSLANLQPLWAEENLSKQDDFKLP